jgi:hypothetical protein
MAIITKKLAEYDKILKIEIDATTVIPVVSGAIKSNKVLNITDFVENTLESTSEIRPVSAKMAKQLKDELDPILYTYPHTAGPEGAVLKSSDDGSSYFQVPYNKLDLVSNTPDVLDARQGKVLNDKITTLRNDVNAGIAGDLGAIPYNASGATIQPGKSGIYTFSNVGLCTFFTAGSQTVKAGDKAIVVYDSILDSYTYSYINNQIEIVSNFAGGTGKAGSAEDVKVLQANKAEKYATLITRDNTTTWASIFDLPYDSFRLKFNGSYPTGTPDLLKQTEINGSGTSFAPLGREYEVTRVGTKGLIFQFKEFKWAFTSDGGARKDASSDDITQLNLITLKKHQSIDLTADSWTAPLQFNSRAEGSYLVHTKKNRIDQRVTYTPIRYEVLVSGVWTVNNSDGFTRDYPVGLPTIADGSEMYYWVEIKNTTGDTKFGTITPLDGNYRIFIWDMVANTVSRIAMTNDIINNNLTNEQLMTKISELIDTTLDGSAGGKVLASAANLETVNENLGKLEPYPTYEIPTLDFWNDGQELLLKVGTVINYHVAATFNRNDVGACTLLKLYKNNVFESDGVLATGALDHEINKVTVTEGDTVFKVTADYAAGVRKHKPITNVVDDREFAIGSVNAPQTASSLTSSEIIYTGVYPVLVSDSVLTNSGRLVKYGVGFQVNFGVGTLGHLQIVKIPVAWGDEGTNKVRVKGFALDGSSFIDYTYADNFVHSIEDIGGVIYNVHTAKGISGETSYQFFKN